MQLDQNRFLTALQAGDNQIGLWSSLCSNLSAEIVAGAGYDWVMLDMEHSPNDLQAILSQLQAYAASNTTALVRPQWNDPVLIKRLMDLGVPGLLIPMVQNAEQAEMAVAATRYPPKGIRGYTGINRANKYGRIGGYVDQVDQQTAVLVQIETKQALDNIDAIANVEGLSGLFFGPGDISADLGLVGQALHQDVWDLIMPAAQKAMAKGIPVGTYVLNADFARSLLAQGFSYVACGCDAAILANGADQLLAKMKANI